MLNLGKYELGPIRLAAVAIPTFFKNENCPNCCCNIYTGIVLELTFAIFLAPTLTFFWQAYVFRLLVHV